MALPAAAGLATSLGASLKSASLSILASFNGMTAVLEGTARAFDKAAEQLADSLRDVTKVDQRLSVINSDLQTTLAGNVDALEDTTAGLANATKALAELRILGFKQNNKNLTDLATRLKLSGQNTQAMFQVAQSLIGLGGLSENAVDRFASDVTRLSIVYQTTADSIVGAVDKLSRNMADLAFTGGAEAVVNLTTKAAAVVGPELANEIGGFIQKLTSSSANLNQVAILGVENVVDRVISGREISVSEIQTLLSTVETNTRSIVGEQGEITQRQFQAVKGLVGDIGIEGTRLSEAFDKQLAATSKITSFSDRIGDLIVVFRENLLAPFNAAVADLQPSFEFLIKGLSVFGTSILNLVASFSPIIAAIFNIVGFVVGAIGTVVNVIAGAISSILKPIGWLLGGGFMGGFGSETGPLSPFGEYKKVFETTLGINEKTYSKTEMIKQSAMSIADTSKVHNRLLETVRDTTLRDSEYIEKMGIAAESSERRIMLEKIRETESLTEFSRQQLLVVDRLARNLELQSMTDLVRIGEETRDAARRTADYTGKSVPKPKLPGAAGG